VSDDAIRVGGDEIRDEEDAGDLSPEGPTSLFFTPFVSSTMAIEPQWIDYNGHLNLAYYHLLFDRAMDEAFDRIGLGEAYAALTNHSYFVVESRVSYRQELAMDDRVRVTLQLLDADDKRIHYYMEVRHALDGWVAAAAEHLALHVSLEHRRAAAFPAHVRDRLREMKAAHAVMPAPDLAARPLGLPRRARMN
jgi:acyl-CoA thioester hydrolase